MIYVAIYLLIGAGFALGMIAEALAREGHLFDDWADVASVPIAVVGWLPGLTVGVIIEFRTARKLGRPFLMK